MGVDLGPIDMLGTDAVGRPGQRRFRLFVRGLLGCAIMWLEKEQLNSLALTLDQALALVTQGQVLRVEASAQSLPEPAALPDDFPSQPDYEFQIGQMRLSFDEEANTFLLSVAPLEILMERGQEPEVVINDDNAISFGFSLRDAQALSTAITTLVSAGRPVCPFCGTPLDGGPHACAKQNGHHKIVTLEEGDEEDEDEDE
jgi:uncharacterized repeat protein (TIGR03847 family)